MTQQLATVFEAAIREHPEDWHMLQRVFVSDLDPDRLAAAIARESGDGARPATERDPANERGRAG